MATDAAPSRWPLATNSASPATHRTGPISLARIENADEYKPLWKRPAASLHQRSTALRHGQKFDAMHRQDVNQRLRASEVAGPPAQHQVERVRCSQLEE